MSLPLSSLHHSLTSIPSSPVQLFKFQSAKSFKLTLERQTIRFGPFVEMNDPRETKKWYSAASPLVDKLLRRSTCIGCFTVDIPAGREDYVSNHHHGWARARMWDQYAGANRRHDGACLVLDFSQFTAYVDDIFNRAPKDPTVLEDPIDGLLGDGNLMYSDYVHYSNLPPHSLRLPKFTSDAELEQILKDRNDLVRDWYMTKNKDWESEQEYRIAIRRWNVPDSQLDKGICFELGDYLRGIILGEDFDSISLSDIRSQLSAASLNHVEVFKCTWQAGQPDLATLP